MRTPEYHVGLVGCCEYFRQSDSLIQDPSDKKEGRFLKSRKFLTLLRDSIHAPEGGDFEKHTFNKKYSGIVVIKNPKTVLDAAEEILWAHRFTRSQGSLTQPKAPSSKYML